MPAGTYDRYGLNGNPFRDLASETLEDIESSHVNLAIDAELRTLRDDVLDKQRKALVAVEGTLGTGKTERLLLAASEGRARKAFVVYFDVSERTRWVLRELSQELQAVAHLAGLARIISAPKWYRDVAAASSAPDGKCDPREAGRAIASALNANAPSFLLLNDLHNLTRKPEFDSFAQTLQALVDAIEPGVMVMFGAYPDYMQWLEGNKPELALRIDHRVELPALTDDEASQLMARELLAKRVVEDLDPLYPFDRAAVARLNHAAGGNPRQLLQVADIALQYAVAGHSNRVDAESAVSALVERGVAEGGPFALRGHWSESLPDGPMATVTTGPGFL